MFGIIEICIGAVILLAALIFGIVRMVKTPKGQRFTKAALTRWLILTIIGSAGGVALIVFGVFAL
ncbi:MAG: hypothetical protein J6N95_06595 [Bacilli bacterium]|nr:hypothetical protein [Bacilli bacterium]